MNYKNYTIEPDNTGYAPKSMTFGIFKEEEYIGSGETVEECKKLIDENILENFEWTDKSVIEFVNWFLNLHKLPFRYKLENMEILESFMRDRPPERSLHARYYSRAKGEPRVSGRGC